MRFDEFLVRGGLTVTAVDRFAGFVVEVGLPTGWQEFREIPGMQVWCDGSQISSGRFCANAVLTMHLIEAPLDEDEVFAMLVEEQVALVPLCGEERREVVPADDGIGVAGLLVLDIPAHEFGALDSLSRSRIIRYGPQTMVAQLTVTAPQSAPVNWAEFALTVRPGAAPVGVSVQVGAPADSGEHV